jgi:hypothetical protein
MVRKRHCNISEALANVFSLSPKLGAPFGPLGLVYVKVCCRKSRAVYLRTTGNVLRIRMRIGLLKVLVLILRLVLELIVSCILWAKGDLQGMNYFKNANRNEDLDVFNFSYVIFFILV